MIWRKRRCKHEQGKAFAVLKPSHTSLAPCLKCGKTLIVEDFPLSGGFSNDEVSVVHVSRMVPGGSRNPRIVGVRS